MGVVVRDVAGEVVAARCNLARGLLAPCAAEAWAGLQAIRITDMALHDTACQIVSMASAEI
jgi:hypothetical protein